MFHCEVCKVDFLQKSDMDLHLQSVHKNKPKVSGSEPIKKAKECKKCDQKFSSDFSLKVHKKLANSVPIECSQCPFKACTTKGIEIHEKNCKVIKGGSVSGFDFYIILNSTKNHLSF